VLDEFSVYRLDAGELEAISLAKKLKLPVLLDDLDARKVADLYKISKVGTLGILVELANKKLIKIDAVLKKLKKTNFFLSKELEKMVRELCK
jgi:predicted nucleic acid-binding protein